MVSHSAQKMGRKTGRIDSFTLINALINSKQQKS